MAGKRFYLLPWSPLSRRVTDAKAKDANPVRDIIKQQANNKLVFNNDITLNPQTFGGANANKVYSLVSWGGDSSSIRRVSSTASTTPETLSIAHRAVKRGSVIVDTHMVRMDIKATDPVKGEVALNGRFVLEVPQGTTVFTAQHVLDLQGRIIAFMRESGYLDKFLNSEP